MPMQQSKSPLAGKLNQSLQKHARDETDYGQDFSKLPGGIHGGIAKLSDARMGVYKTGPNQGQPFVYLAGIVVEPVKAVDTVKAWDPDLLHPVTKRKVGGVKIVSSQEVTVEGRRTGLTLPLCDTKKQDGTVISYDDNVNRMMNELRKIGGPNFTEDIADENDLAVKLQAMVEVAPHFRFSTSQAEPTAQYPNARIWENWHGNKGLEDYNPEESAPAVADNTPPATQLAAQVAANGKPPAKTPPTKTKVKAPEPEPEPEEEAGTTPGELAQASDQGDDAAIEALTKLALESGLSQEDIDSAASWGAVVDQMETASTEASEEEGADTEEAAEEEEVAEEPEVEIAKGEVHLLKLLDPKTKKKAAKATEVEVLTTDKKAKTCTLKNLDQGKVITDPKTKKPVVFRWDELESN